MVALKKLNLTTFDNPECEAGTNNHGVLQHLNSSDPCPNQSIALTGCQYFDVDNHKPLPSSIQTANIPKGYGLYVFRHIMDCFALHNEPDSLDFYSTGSNDSDCHVVPFYFNEMDPKWNWRATAFALLQKPGKRQTGPSYDSAHPTCISNFLPPKT